MERPRLAIVIGLAMLSGSLSLALVGSSTQSLGLLIISLVIGIGGAVVAVRGMIEFLAARF